MAQAKKALTQELQRLEKLKFYENMVYAQGFKLIAGIDEVGRGCIAGPVAAAAVILPRDFFLPGVNDSKQLSEKKRLQLAAEIKKEAVAWSLSFMSTAYIDRENILNATKEAMRIAVAELVTAPEFLLIDAVKIPDIHIQQYSIIKGDSLSVSIACASIVAKVERDHYMTACDQIYPGYGFAQHKGYGTRKHIEALYKLGPTPIHRQTFEPVKSFSGGSYGSQPGLF